MPNHLVLVRHGESEGNYARGRAKRGDDSLFTDEYRNRADHQHRLTPRGVEQARIAGRWVTQFVLGTFDLEHFDRYYCSPYIRPMETAGNLGLPMNDEGWRLSYLVRERDYGDMEGLTPSEFIEHYPHSAKKRSVDPLFWKPPGGESYAEVAETRVREMYDTFHREIPGGSVIIVAHGEFLKSNRLALEQPTTEQWEQWEDDPAYKMDNCRAMHYTRINPETGEVDPHMRWMRSVCPWKTPDDPGEWHEFGRQTYSSDRLLEIVEAVPRLIVPGPQF